jgi:hypothetical protein
MSRPCAYQISPSLTDSLPYSTPKGVSIRRTIQELLETKVGKESINMYQDWEEAYRAAVLETDHNKLIDKIDSATTVLRKSLLEASSPPEPIRERQRIEDALRTLDMIRRIELQIHA